MSASLLVGLAVAGSSGAASSEDTVAETSVPTTSGAVASSGVVTTDFVTLTDDSGTIIVDVPSSWTDVDTAPSGGEFPQIEATPYRQAYYDTFDVPGVTYRAIHFTTDTESLVHNLAIPDLCAHEAVQPYDDGSFVGSHLVDSECGSFGTAEYHVIVANPANQAFTAVVVVQITGPHELPILERILDSFNVAAGAGPTTSAPSTSSTVVAPTTTTDAAGVFPPPTGEVPEGWTDLIDDTGTIRISVPTTWTATRLVSPSDATVPWISATTDEALFFPPEGTADTFGVLASCTGPSRSPSTRRRGWRRPASTTSAPPVRSRLTTTASSSATSRRTQPATAQHRASCASRPTRPTKRSPPTC
jgi:hypothetical protein